MFATMVSVMLYFRGPAVMSMAMLPMLLMMMTMMTMTCASVHRILECDIVYEEHVRTTNS